MTHQPKQSSRTEQTTSSSASEALVKALKAADGAVQEAQLRWVQWLIDHYPDEMQPISTRLQAKGMTSVEGIIEAARKDPGLRRAIDREREGRRISGRPHYREH